MRARDKFGLDEYENLCEVWKGRPASLPPSPPSPSVLYAFPLFLRDRQIVLRVGRGGAESDQFRVEGWIFWSRSAS